MTTLSVKLLIILLSLITLSCADDSKEEGMSYGSYLSGTYSNKDNTKRNKLEMTYNTVEIKNADVVFETADNKIGQIKFKNIITGEPTNRNNSD